MELLGGLPCRNKPVVPYLGSMSDLAIFR